MIRIKQPDLLIDCVSTLLQENLSLINEYRENNQRFYRRFYINKKSGGLRKIESPTNKILKQLLNDIHCCFCKADIFFPECITGFIEKRSIVTNASIHLGSELIVNIDIKNFFNSIKKVKIIYALSSIPFIFPNEIAVLLTDIATKNGYLPQGSPLSPILSNIVSNKLDTNLSEFCARKGIRFSRYADDMTFSILKGRIEDEELSKIRQIIEGNGFLINEKKFKIKRKSKRLMVTGIKVNERLNVKRNYLKNIKATLHNWEKSDLNEARIMLDSLRGKIEFIGMVRGKEDSIYHSFLNKFYYLKDRDEKFNTNQKNDFDDLMAEES